MVQHNVYISFIKMHEEEEEKGHREKQTKRETKQVN